MQHVSLWGESWDSMLGVILFNFALVMAIPAWLSEKKPSVSVSKVVYGSTILSTVLYILVGLLGAMAIPNINANALAPMVSGAFGPGLRMGASLFAFFIVGLDIPLFSVLTRYNLTNSGLCSPRMANILVVYLPWSTAWMFYQGSAIDELLSWGGILFTSAVAFLLPLYLAIRVLQSDDRGEQPGSSSIQVYGDWISSKRMELVATVTLFVIAFAAVVTAIVGQALYDQQQETLLRNDTYVNSTIGQVDAAADDPDL
jgi:amino acid permease